MKKMFLYILCVSFVGFIILLFLPIKFAIKMDTVTSEKFYICEQQSTTGPSWQIIGDEKGIYELPIDVFIEGKDPLEILTQRIHLFSKNRYIIYGKIEDERDYVDGETYPVIYSIDFDILYPIDRGESLRFFVPKKYLTVFDYAKIWEIN